MVTQWPVHKLRGRRMVLLRAVHADGHASGRKAPRGRTTIVARPLFAVLQAIAGCVLLSAAFARKHHHNAQIVSGLLRTFRKPRGGGQ